MKKLFSVIMVLAVFLMTTALAEVTQPAPELKYVEKVHYKGNGLFEIEFMRNVPWRTDYVLTAKDDADNALTVSVVGGDANDAFVRVEGDIRSDALYTFTFVANNGVIPAIGQSTAGFSYANYCEYCLAFGHDEMACADRKATGISYDVDRCDICGELGHEDDNCPDRQAGVVYCDECAGTGHDDDNCPNERCDECGEYGHDDDNCPNERCDDCGEKGHDDDHCPNHKSKHHDH